MAGRSPLEQLPVELLHDIFLYSANVQLPLCSKQLLATLSSDHLKYEIALQILVYQADKTHVVSGTRLLERRFFTWDFLVRYMQFAHQKGWPMPPEMLRQHLNHSHHTHPEPGSRYVVSFSDVRERIPSLYDFDEVLGCHSYMLSQVGRMSREGEMFCQKQGWLTTAPILALRGLSRLHIPEKLVRTDFGLGHDRNDRMRMLLLLFGYGCELELVKSSASEIAAASMLNAIKHEDTELLLLLLHERLHVQPTQEMLEMAMSTKSALPVSYLTAHRSGPRARQFDTDDPKIQALLQENKAWSDVKKQEVGHWLKHDEIALGNPLIEADWSRWQ